MTVRVATAVVAKVSCKRWCVIRSESAYEAGALLSIPEVGKKLRHKLAAQQLEMAIGHCLAKF